MEDLKRMRSIAAHYRNLQGLRMLPWFLWVLAFSAVNPIMGLPQGYLDYQCLFIVPGLAIPWVLSKLIGDYYDRHFGRIEGLPSRNRPVEVLSGFLFIVIVYIGFVIDTFEWLPMSVAGLILAAGFMVGWWKTGRFPNHMVVLAVVLVVLSLLPLAGIPADGHWTDLFGGFVTSIVLGIIMSIGSVLSHITLVRNLKALSQVES